MKPKHCVLIVFLLAVQTHFAQYTDVINSNRPSESVSAFAVGQNIFQLESGFNMIREEFKDREFKYFGFNTDLTARYGFLKEDIELVGSMLYQRDELTLMDEKIFRNKIKFIQLGAKFMLYDPDRKEKKKKPNLYSWKKNQPRFISQLVPAVGVYAGINYYFSNNPFLIYTDTKPQFGLKGILITQNAFNGGYIFINNFFVDHYYKDFSSAGIITTLTKSLSQRYSIFLEHKFGKSKFYDEGSIKIGGAYLYWKNIQFDVSVGKSYVTTPDNLTAGVGVSWRFEDNYKEQLYRTNRPKKPKDKSSKEEKAATKKNKLALKKTKKNKKEKESTTPETDKK